MIEEVEGRALSGEAELPYFRVLGTMEYGVNDDSSIGGFVKDFKRKASDQRAPVIVQRHWKHSRMPSDQENACFNAAKEIFPESGFLHFIPFVGLLHV